MKRKDLDGFKRSNVYLLHALDHLGGKEICSNEVIELVRQPNAKQRKQISNKLSNMAHTGYLTAVKLENKNRRILSITEGGRKLLESSKQALDMVIKELGNEYFLKGTGKVAAKASDTRTSQYNVFKAFVELGGKATLPEIADKVGVDKHEDAYKTLRTNLGNHRQRGTLESVTNLERGTNRLTQKGWRIAKNLGIDINGHEVETETRGRPLAVPAARPAQQVELSLSHNANNVMDGIAAILERDKRHNEDMERLFLIAGEALNSAGVLNSAITKLKAKTGAKDL